MPTTISARPNLSCGLLLSFLFWLALPMSSASQELPTLTDPSRFAGPWQAQTKVCGRPQRVRIHIMLLSRITGKEDHLVEVDVQFSTDKYEGWFSSAGGSVGLKFDGQQLWVHRTPMPDRPFLENTELNLRFQPQAQQWTGTLTCEGQKVEVVFERPQPRQSDPRSPLIGVWSGRAESYGFVSCLHIVQQDESLVYWLDRRVGNNYGNYGEQVSAGFQGNRFILSLARPGGNVQGFFGTLTPDKLRIEGVWSAPVGIPLVFTQVRDGRCTVQLAD
jgi:hypothetical protein